MPSLLEALEEKYGLGTCLDTNESMISIYIPKLPPRLTVPELLVLNDCDIDRAGEPEDLRKKCCSVKELDLAQNKLHNWSEVFTILSHMPRVEFVNLSLNRLSGPIQPPMMEYGMNKLRSLVLNNTRLDWDSVDTLINMLPALEELHLSLNDYRNVLIDTVISDDDYDEVFENEDCDDNDDCADDDEEHGNDDDDDDAEETIQMNRQRRLIQYDRNADGDNKDEENKSKQNNNNNIISDYKDKNSNNKFDDNQNNDDNICSCGNVSTSLPNQNSQLSSSPSSSTSTTVTGGQPSRFSTKRSVSMSSTYKKTNAHEGVKKLHFTGNPVSEWNEICRLGRVFPNLQSLVLAECPLKAVEPIPKNPSSPSIVAEGNESETTSDKHEQNDDEKHEPPHTYFKNLTFLNLSNTNINTWDDIDRLAKFPSLRNLRVQNWPLWDKCDSTEHERRQLLIARLPFVKTLNGGGIIGTEEREDAERAFIRYFLDKPESDRPERYTELLTIHGRLDPLVNVDLRPEKRVKVTFTYGDISEVRSVDVYRTIIDLKSRLERLANIPAAKMRLYYVDQDLRDHQGPEEMKYPHKQLYSYNIRNGDEIIIDQKR